MGDKTGYFVWRHSRRARSRPEIGRPKVSGNKKCDLIPMKELLPLTGYIRRRLFAYRHEKAFPYLYSRNLPAVLLYLHQCRTARVAAQTQSEGFDKGGTR